MALPTALISETSQHLEESERLLGRSASLVGGFLRGSLGLCLGFGPSSIILLGVELLVIPPGSVASQRYLGWPIQK